MSGGDPIDCGAVVLRRVTEKAILVEHPQVIAGAKLIPAHHRWIPKRAVHATSEVHGRDQTAGHRGALVLLRWFVEKEANNHIGPAGQGRAT
jgi:hypothetical protein